MLLAFCHYGLVEVKGHNTSCYDNTHKRIPSNYQLAVSPSSLRYDKLCRCTWGYDNGVFRDRGVHPCTWWGEARTHDVSPTQDELDGPLVDLQLRKESGVWKRRRRNSFHIMAEHNRGMAEYARGMTGEDSTAEHNELTLVQQPERWQVWSISLSEKQQLVFYYQDLNMLMTV